MSSDFNRVAKRKVNKPALVSIHGSQLNGATRLHSLLSAAARHALNLVPTPALVTLDVNDNRVVKADALGEHGDKHNLERVKRHTMTTNEDGKVATVYVKDEFALVAIILINRTGVLAKAGQNTSKDLDGRVGNNIELLVRQGTGLLKARTNGLELIGLLEGSSLIATSR